MKQTINVNKEWKFTQPGRTEIILDLPHTWNNVDGQDGGNDYYRGSCIYRKTIRLDSFRTGRSVWLEINGASLCADVYAGDKLLLRHEGGYSTFRVNLTDSVVNDSIDLKIVVDNSHNENIYPQKADFTFYGGIYRDVNLIITDNAYFRLDNCGAPPMKITPVIDGTNADVKIETEIIGSADFVEFSIDGVCSQEVKPENGRAVSTMTIKNARLWHGRKDPHLYEVHAKLIKKAQ
jgi:beta-galactosidase